MEYKIKYSGVAEEEMELLLTLEIKDMPVPGKSSTGIKKSFYEYTPAGPLDVEESNCNVVP